MELVVWTFKESEGYKHQLYLAAMEFIAQSVRHLIYPPSQRFDCLSEVVRTGRSLMQKTRRQRRMRRKTRRKTKKKMKKKMKKTMKRSRRRRRRKRRKRSRKRRTSLFVLLDVPIFVFLMPNWWAALVAIFGVSLHISAA